MKPASEYAALFKKLGYEFVESANLLQALTHRSANKSHNERLEFLGDALLGMIIAEELYQRFPKHPEGHLTRMRSSLVKGETLAKLALEFELGNFLKLGSGEMKSGGFRRESILADAVEAIIGAIYLEAGMDTCRVLVLKWYEQRLNKLNPDVHLKDDKTRLQEYLQGRKIPLPEYKVVSISGKDHDQTFLVECNIASLSKNVTAKGNSRRKAEQKAARLIYQEIQ